jgi:hypothetical protein
MDILYFGIILRAGKLYQTNLAALVQSKSDGIFQADSFRGTAAR